MDSSSKVKNKKIKGARHTAKDVARLAGVSQSTVSRVLSGDPSPFFSKATRKGVMGAATVAYALQDESLTLVAADSSHTIGSGGQLNTTRPVSIASCYCRANSLDYPVRIIQFDEWNSIVDKTATSDIPELVYYEPTMATGTLQVWPVPTTANVLHLTTRVPLTALVLGTTVSLPPGWEDAIAANGAIAIAPEFQTEPLPSVIKMAQDSLKGIKRTNSRPIKAYSDLH